MLKKLCAAVFVIVVVAALSAAVFADPPGGTGGAAIEGGNAGGGTSSGEGQVLPGEAGGESGSLEVAEAEEEKEETLLDKMVGSKDMQATEQFLVEIRKPGKDEIVYTELYNIYGIAVSKDEAEIADIELILAVYDAQEDAYVELVGTDGTSRWGVVPAAMGEGICSKEFTLKEGDNLIKIIAYKKSQADKLEAGVNLQINYFKIKYIGQERKERLINDKADKVEIFEGLLK